MVTNGLAEDNGLSVWLLTDVQEGLGCEAYRILFRGVCLAEKFSKIIAR